MRDVIAFRGDRDLWLDFTHAVKKKRQEVWDALEPMIRQYVDEK